MKRPNMENERADRKDWRGMLNTVVMMREREGEGGCSVTKMDYTSIYMYRSAES